MERKRVHTSRCGMAKREKCVCICGGARHQELIKKAVDDPEKTRPVEQPREVLIIG
jgi:hypothetical protein